MGVRGTSLVDPYTDVLVGAELFCLSNLVFIESSVQVPSLSITNESGSPILKPLTEEDSQTSNFSRRRQRFCLKFASGLPELREASFPDRLVFWSICRRHRETSYNFGLQSYPCERFVHVDSDLEKGVLWGTNPEMRK